MEMFLQPLIWVLLALGVGSFITASVLMFQERRELMPAGEAPAPPPAPKRSVLPAQHQQLRVSAPLPATPPKVQRDNGFKAAAPYSMDPDEDEDAPTELMTAEKVAELLGPVRAK